MESKRIIRPDIQILRAVAVVLVVLFHLWPERFRSGFIGVDVFFVISGFLISSHLIDEVHRTGSIRLSNFWARRIRRLLPIALLVIAVTTILVLIFAPVSNWSEYGSQAIASVFYSENWVLALNSVNYLNADNPPTAVQQYWSLSVEEQFYILWPLLILGVIWLSKRRQVQSQRLLFIALVLLTLGSLGLSIWFAVSNNPSGYFNTFSRVWEFGFGGICALVAQRFHNKQVPKNKELLRWLGAILLGLSIVFITPELPFPGWIALLPVVGTGLLLLGGVATSQRVTPKPNIAIAPIIWLGGISYSLYLWHWPFIVLYPDIAGKELTTVTKFAVLAFVILLSWITATYVEKPVQRMRFLSQGKISRTYIGAVLIVGVSLSPVVALFISLNARAVHSKELASEMSETDCFGGMSRITGPVCAEFPPTPLVPDLSQVHDDVPTTANECKSDTAEVKMCSFGLIDSPTKIALVGDSHAGHWFPAVQEIALRNGWQLDIYLRSSCTFSTVARRPDYAECPIWSQAAIEKIVQNGHYKVAIISSLAPNLYGETHTDEALRLGFEAVWRPLLQAGTKIVVIKDTPYWLEDPLSCINARSSDYDACDRPQSEVFQTPDLEYLTAEQTPGVSAVDMTPYFCQLENCSTVIGGVIVYSDYHHMTTTYSKSLTEPLSRKLEQALQIKLK